MCVRAEGVCLYLYDSGDDDCNVIYDYARPCF